MGGGEGGGGGAGSCLKESLFQTHLGWKNPEKILKRS